MTGPRGDMAPEFDQIGDKIEIELPEDDWRPVPDKPHFWINKKGQMKYTPPSPFDPITILAVP